MSCILYAKKWITMPVSFYLLDTGILNGMYIYNVGAVMNVFRSFVLGSSDFLIDLMFVFLLISKLIK